MLYLSNDIFDDKKKIAIYIYILQLFYLKYLVYSVILLLMFL